MAGELLRIVVGQQGVLSPQGNQANGGSGGGGGSFVWRQGEGQPLVAAGGGGDMPEDLNAALEKTLHRLEWRQGRALRLAFVVADAPPHHYVDAPYTYDQALLDASGLGVKFFPVASGGSDGTAEFVFRQLAQFTLGRFVFITEGGGSHHGSGGSDYEVDPNDFRVEALDSLIVRLVGEELDAWSGAE